MERETLPKDGADYHCTFKPKDAYYQCGEVTTIGITMADWERLMKEGYKGMRAVCSDHFKNLENGKVN